LNLESRAGARLNLELECPNLYPPESVPPVPRFRQELTAIAKKKRLRLNIQLECSSFPLVSKALETGNMAAILPSVAAAELKDSAIQESKIPALDSLSRQMCLAWNPRTLRIRQALEKARQVFSVEFRV